MRFFTALLACALVMGACSQSGIEPASDVSGGTRASENKIIVFHKVVQVGDEQVAAEAGQFSFELWGVKKNGKGEAESFGLFTTDENGDVRINFSELKGQGRDKYYFTEYFADPEERAKWEDLGELPLTIEANWGAVWDEFGEFAFGPDGPTIVNIPIAEEDPEPEPDLEHYSSVTLTNVAGEGATVYPDSNHFCYATLTRADLSEGVWLEMVVGNECKDVGDAFVQLVNGEIVVSEIVCDGTVGDFGGFAFTSFADQPKSNGKKGKYSNPTALLKGHRSASFACPEEGDPIYIYVHFE